MRYFALLLLLTAGCRDPLLTSTPICGEVCYPGPAETAGVGVCSRGYWSCPAEGEPVCVGYVGPTEETCDGLDNDCDGVADGFARRCETACGGGYDVCTTGAWAGCDAPQPQPEVCDAHDNDCDGQTDEAVDLPVEFCYPGDEDELRYGECRPGLVRCGSGGTKTCVGYVTPAAEACDSRDNDCDGVVDEGVTSTHAVDLVFVIDNSGSMGDDIARVRTATSAWATRYGSRTDLRFAVVTAPDDDAMFQPHLYRDFTDVTGLQDALAKQDGMSADWREATLDSIDALASPTNPLNLTWSLGGRRVVVIYTDEVPQHVRNPGRTAADVGQTAASAGVTVHVFASPAYASNWSPAVTPTGGLVLDLSGTATDIEAELDLVISSAACGP